MTSTASSDGGPAGRSTARGKSVRRPVLHRPEHAPVVVAVDRPPRPPRLLRPLAPTRLVRVPVPAALPPDARLADGRRRLERRARQPDEPRAHVPAGGEPMPSTSTSTDDGVTAAMRSEVVRDAAPYSSADVRRAPSPLELDAAPQPHTSRPRRGPTPHRPCAARPRRAPRDRRRRGSRRLRRVQAPPAR